MEMFSRLPGVEGLLLIVHAMASRGVDASRVAAARLAVQEYADLVGTAGGSQAKLIRAMQARAESPGGDPEAARRLAFRRRIFEGAAGITGAWSDTLLMISAYRPSPRADGQLERLAVFANLGLRRRAGAFPLFQRSTWSSPAVARTLDGVRPLSSMLDGIITEFTTAPGPIVESLFTENQTDRTIEFEDTGSEPVDVVLGTRSDPSGPDPRLAGDRILQVANTPRTPTRNLLHEVFLDAALAEYATVRNGVYFIGARGTVTGEPGTRWMDSLGSDSEVQLLGPHGGGSDACGLYPRYAELLAYAFDRAAWKADNMRNYSWHEAFPV